MLEIGSLIDGKYKILNEVGHGGMSVVYLAMNERANKQWAIKEVRKDGVEDFEVVKQSLVAETNMLKKLSHPSLPDIVDVIDEDDRFLIVMDYIEGNSLKTALQEYGAQSQKNVIKWAKQLCDGTRSRGSSIRCGTRCGASGWKRNRRRCGRLSGRRCTTRSGAQWA